MEETSIFEPVLTKEEFGYLLIPPKAATENSSPFRPKTTVCEVQLLYGLVLRNKDLHNRVVVALHLVILIES